MVYTIIKMVLKGCNISQNSEWCFPGLWGVQFGVNECTQVKIRVFLGWFCRFSGLRS